MGKNTDMWYAVVNPYAGSGKTLAQWRLAERMLYNKGISYKFITPETPSDSRKRIEEACIAGQRNFIAVGGDGTVHNLIHTIISFAEKQAAADFPALLSEFKIAVLPIGSGNDWIRSHNIPKDLATIIEMIAGNSFRPQDVARAEILDPSTSEVVSTHYMANVGGYSFDANVCDVVNFQKSCGMTGKLIYVKALLKIAFRQKCHVTRIVCDGRTVFDEPCFTISIGNGMYSGGGLCQTPGATMDDGILDIMVAPKFPLWKILVHLPKLMNKRAHDIPFLKFYKASEMTIAPEAQGQLVEIDGEIIGRAPVKLTVIPQCLNVLHRDI